MRLQKFLSQAGVASRRKAEKLIAAGRVRVNGRPVTEMGAEVDPDRDRVEADGRTISAEEKVYIILHKPAGYLCALSDRFHRPLITDLVRRIPQRVYPAGRLDLDSEGLLVLTNDGEFALRLTHPRHEIEKTYYLRLRGELNGPASARLEEGVVLGDGFRTGPARVRVLSPDKKEVEITIAEGKKRQVKRMLKAVGNRVTYLKRTAVGPLRLGDLERGKWRELTGEEIALILDGNGEWGVGNSQEIG